MTSIPVWTRLTESLSGASWSGRTVQNYKAFPSPETFVELQNIPLDKPYNFLMSLNKEFIEKEISRQGVWELPKVESARKNLCQQWFYTDCGHGTLIKRTIDLSKTAPVTEPAPEPSTAIVCSY